MTTIISSQRYLNNEILNEKISMLENEMPAEIVLMTYHAELEGEEYEILFDGHHTLEAARQLNITVRFESTNHPEKLSGEELFEAEYNDSDWYDINTNKLIF